MNGIFHTMGLISCHTSSSDANLHTKTLLYIKARIAVSSWLFDCLQYFIKKDLWSKWRWLITLMFFPAQCARWYETWHWLLHGSNPLDRFSYSLIKYVHGYFLHRKPDSGHYCLLDCCRRAITWLASQQENTVALLQKFNFIKMKSFKLRNRELKEHVAYYSPHKT